MDEEQTLYVETVRRACHTIQLITTNVLDFTRLERANDEAQARPVLVELRRFICNLAEITEDRGPRTDGNGHGLELIVDIGDDIPEAVYLDETYLTRIVRRFIEVRCETVLISNTGHESFEQCREVLYTGLHPGWRCHGWRENQDDSQ